MRFSIDSVLLLAVAASALSVPEFVQRDIVQLDARAPKGGGGHGDKGGSGGSSSSGKGSDSGSSSSSSSGKGLGSSTSSTGGRTTSGSGVKPAVGGFYGGGASVPFTSGSRSASGISPLFIGAGLGFGFGALWAHGAWNYPYTHPITFHNSSTNSTETKPVDCLCAASEECGCDDNSNSTYVSSLIGNGTYSSLNQSLVTVADINGTNTIVINGTLPNGTTAAGGTVSASGASGVVEASRYLALSALIACGVSLL